MGADKLLRIMVVDDERDIRDGSERILSRLGHDVVKAEQGEEALDLLRVRRTDIILLDLKMPGMDGMEVLENILRSNPETLVIIVTGFATIETAIEAMKKGAYDFMTKPFRPDQLRLVVGRAVEHLRVKEERDRLSAEREAGLWAITTEKSRLKTVVDSIIAGLLIIELDKRIVMCNPAFNQMMGFNKDDITGSFLGEHPRLENVNEMVDELIESYSGQSGFLNREFVVPGDRPTYIRATVNSVVSETGNILGLVAVLRDVTRAKEEERERSAYIAMLTHELRSPLGAVDTQFHVVLKGLAGELSEKQRDMLSRMRERVGNVQAMINDLLDLSRIEARQFVQEKKASDITNVVKDTIELLSDQAVEKELTLSVRLEPSLPHVLADPASLKEATTNLISNAIRYTPKGGRVEVTTGVDGGYVVLNVADDGIGIAKEHQDKIFNRFFRVKDEKTRHVVGTGLGLPIVKAIVEEHLGTVSVESEPGRGSVFTVSLPKAE